MAVLTSVGAGGGSSLGTLFIRLTANSTDLIRGMDQAVVSVDRGTTAINKNVLRLGTIVAGVFAGMGAAAVREFAMFESSFAGVRKTVDATENVFAKLSDSFRQMAREIPANVNEINRVAEAAGSLGIQADVIEDFTKVMIDMGNTTNLSAEQAATEMARFANITGMAKGDFDRLGSTLVKLGNTLASTESEIMTMGLRLAGAGRAVGMAESEILALAGALSSVGIEAEMGGTAVSQTMIRMSKAVKQGSDELKIFAGVAGQTAEEFQKAFADDATNAVLNFLKGLDVLQRSGADTFTLLENMGLDGARLSDVMTRAAGAQKLFNDAIRTGKQAWAANNALSEEARKRYETFSSQITTTIGLLRDFLIEIGKNLVPALKMINEEFREWAKSNEKIITSSEGVTNAAAALYAVVKTATDLVKGLRMAFKLVAIAIADGAAMYFEFFNGVVKVGRSAAEKIVDNFSHVVNGIIAGANFLISKIPDKVWKLLGFEPGMKNNLIPSFSFKSADFGSGNDTFLKGWAEGLREHANDLGRELEEMVMPPLQLKRTMEEVRNEMERQVTYSKEELALLVAQVDAATELSAEQKKMLETEKEKKRFEKAREGMEKEISMLGGMDLRSVRGPQTFGLGFGDKDFGQAVMLNDEMMQAKEHLAFLADLEKQETNLTAEERVKRLKLMEAYNEKTRKLKEAEYELAVSSSTMMFSDLASIAEAFAGRQSGIYKAMFAASKAFAIAESIIKIQQGIAAAASMPWPLNLAAMASVVAATSNIVSSIQAVKLEFSGKRAVGGPVRAGQAYMVGERGPEPFIPSSSGTIMPNSSLRGLGGVRVIVNNFAGARIETTEREEEGGRVVEIAVRQAEAKIASDIRNGTGPVAKAMQSSFSLRRGQ